MDKQDEALILLKEIRTISRLIDDMQEHIDEIYTKLTSTTVKPKEVNVQSSGDPDPLATKMGEIMEYQEKVLEHYSELCKKRNVALSIVKQMNVDHQRIITLRYFEGYSVEKIGEKIGYSYRWAWEKIHEAEEEFITIYEKTT